MKINILAFAAHPDDAELSCCGTLLKHMAMGKTAGIIDITRGELGTRGNAETRNGEATAATKIMGLHVRENLDLPDCFFSGDKESLLKIINCIRKYRPDIVLANAVSDRHPDHGKASKLLYDACFLSGLIKIETTENNLPQPAWRPAAVYNYIQDYLIRPDFVIDITPYMNKKIEAIKAFKSQFFDPDSVEPVTSISTEEFMDFIYARALNFGRAIGVKYAEGFTITRTPGINDLYALI